MSACAVGEFQACHVTGAELPEYAPALVLSRYENPEYLKELGTWADSGQL